VDVLSFHNDSFQSGENPQETVLHPGPGAAEEVTGVTGPWCGLPFHRILVARKESGDGDARDEY
jgi:hypothetical protein